MSKRPVGHCIVLLCFWSSPLAVAGNTPSIEVGFDLMYFDYSEFDQNGTLLDQETAWLPGLTASWRYQWPKWYVAADIDYHGGNVTYEGKTQPAGVPLTTTTETHISTVRIRGGYSFHVLEGVLSSLYGGLGYHYWYRNILPATDSNGNPVSGLLENYHWTFAFLGMELGIYESRTTRLALDLRAKHLLQGTMDIDFQGFGGFDNTTVQLGLGGSVRLGIPLSFVVADNSRLVIEPYFDNWNIPQGPASPVTVNAVPVAFVYEPRSETRNFGFSLRYQARF